MAIKPANQLADKVAFLARLTPGQAADALRVIGTVIVNEIKQGHAVEFTNFGLFDQERVDVSPYEDS